MRLLVVANRAPIQRTGGQWSAAIGGLATALLPVLEERGGVWVAMHDDADAPRRQEWPEEDARLAVRRVPMSRDEIANYYDGMANRVLWPISHYMLGHFALERGYVEDYRRVNARFAETVIEEHEPGDVIWVHDYHLMLVPGLVRKAIPDARLAHFWHIPWPAMEVFRILPWAREFLEGLLGCDLVGFHVEEYAKNFVETAVTLLGAERIDCGVRWKGRDVCVGVHPIGIDTERFEGMASEPSTEREARALRREIGTQHLIVGVDRLDYTKGVLERLTAFEAFLRDHPAYHEHVTLFQIATPSRTRVGSYQDLKREVDEVVGRINGTFSRGAWQPVLYNTRRYTQEELAVFYRAADVAFITPLRDGMNLVAHEFIASSPDGVLVLSEMAGASYLLPEALLVNPYDQDDLQRQLKAALDMPEEERRHRHEHLVRRVRQLDVHRWARRFLEDIPQPTPTT